MNADGLPRVYCLALWTVKTKHCQALKTIAEQFVIADISKMEVAEYTIGSLQIQLDMGS
jgi:hypothetical protein